MTSNHTLIEKNNWRKKILCKKEHHTNEMKHFLDDPELFFAKHEHEVIKNTPGESTAVRKINLDGKYYIVKRFNINNWIQTLKRALTPDRARHVWAAATQLETLKVHSIYPVAALTYRCGPFNQSSYIIHEYIKGTGAWIYFKSQKECPAKCLETIIQFCKLFQQLKQHGIEHQDLQWANMLITEKGIALLDLDHVRWHNPKSKRFKKIFKNEIQHFLRSTKKNPVIYKAFLKQLNEMGLTK